MRKDFAPLLDRGRPLFLKVLPLPATLRVLVLAPHPDDFDAIGITMRLFRDNGNRIDLAVLTSGADGVEVDSSSPLTPEDRMALREKEQAESCGFFGLPSDQLTFLRFEKDREGHPEILEKNLSRLTAFWRTHQPDIVLMPHGNDTNAGHRRTYELFRRVVKTELRDVAALLNRDPKTVAMRNDVYTVFGEEEAKWKAELLRFHQSQHKRNFRTRGHGIDERILQVNRQTAMELGRGDAYAEVFELEFHSGGGGGP